MMFTRTTKFLRWSMAAFFACVASLWVGCSESSEKPLFPEDEISEEMELKLSGWKVKVISPFPAGSSRPLSIQLAR